MKKIIITLALLVLALALAGCGEKAGQVILPLQNFDLTPSGTNMGTAHVGEKMEISFSNCDGCMLVKSRELNPMTNKWDERVSNGRASAPLGMSAWSEGSAFKIAHKARAHPIPQSKLDGPRQFELTVQKGTVVKTFSFNLQ